VLETGGLTCVCLSMVTIGDVSNRLKRLLVSHRSSWRKNGTNVRVRGSEFAPSTRLEAGRPTDTDIGVGLMWETGKRDGVSGRTGAMVMGDPKTEGLRRRFGSRTSFVLSLV
jgi:hypothetical protein